MQAPTPQRPHLFPFHPSWLVAGGLALLGAVPHQIPKEAHRVLHTWIGAAIFTGLAALVATKTPVLGVAIMIMLAGVWNHAPPLREPFMAEVLNKDKVKSGSRWFSEETLHEKPSGIQERTENPALNFDEIPDHHENWAVEDALDEHPHAIQDRPVSNALEYNESQSMGHR